MTQLSQISTIYTPPKSHLASPDELPTPGGREANAYNRTAPTSTFRGVAHRTDARGHSGPSVSRPADELGEGGMTRPFLGSPPVETKKIGFEPPNNSPTPGLNHTFLSQRPTEAAQDPQSSLQSYRDWLAQEDLNIVDEYPIAAGGFADVWTANHGDRKVVLKSYRLYESFGSTRVATVRSNHIL